MNTPDLINGLFEAGGALLSWLNVKRLLRDRTVQGVYWPITGFWSLWGAWNIFFYSHLACWASFAGGLALVIGNTVWVVLAAYYAYRRHAQSKALQRSFLSARLAEAIKPYLEEYNRLEKERAWEEYNRLIREERK
jgi:hypothetical protein